MAQEQWKCLLLEAALTAALILGVVATFVYAVICFVAGAG
jgi:hypothetical protein